MGAGLASGACCLSRDSKDDEATSADQEPRPSPRFSPFSGLVTHRGFPLFQEGRPEDFYVVGETLSHQHAARFAKKVVTKGGGIARAMEFIKKQPRHKASWKSLLGSDVDQKATKVIQQEMAIMSSLDHPNIVRLYETFAGDDHYFMVSELCEGGELIDVITGTKHLNEAQVAHVVEQICRGICYMHNSSVCHRNLKLESFLCLNKDGVESNVIKIKDFSAARRFSAGQVLHSQVGTALYIAPEVLRGSYTQLCDVWSLGVVAFALLCGKHPFHGTSDIEVLTKVSRMSYNFKRSSWEGVSQDAKVLISQMLTSKRERVTAEEVLDHRWVHQKAPQAKSGAVARDSMVLESLSQFGKANKMKKLALTAVATQIDERYCKSEEFRDIFQELDADKDGHLTLDEMRTGLEKAGIQDLPAELEDMLNALDTDGSGLIEYTEFVASAICKEVNWQDDVLQLAFQKFDLDGSGSISHAELREIMRSTDAGESSETALDRKVTTALHECDEDGDGEIGFEEFKHLICNLDDPIHN